jgi:hypothetical protein
VNNAGVIRTVHHPALSVRVVAAAATAALLGATLAGCSSSGNSGAASNPLPSSSAAISATPGSLSVVAPQVHLMITDAKLASAPGGKSTLGMTVLNSGTTPEHLTSVGIPGKGWATMSGASVNSAGVLLPVGTSVGIGGSGEPQVTLPAAPTAAPGGTEQLTLLFALAGEVKLTAVVVH